MGILYNIWSTSARERCRGYLNGQGVMLTGPRSSSDFRPARDFLKGLLSGANGHTGRDRDESRL